MGFVEILTCGVEMRAAQAAPSAGAEELLAVERLQPRDSCSALSMSPASSDDTRDCGYVMSFATNSETIAGTSQARHPTPHCARARAEW